jgi:hypothetical protein
MASRVLELTIGPYHDCEVQVKCFRETIMLADDFLYYWIWATLPQIWIFH